MYILDALQKYADNIEQIGEGFVVLVENVHKSLNVNKVTNLDQDSVVQAKKPCNNLPCPHLRLRVSLCTLDKDKISL